MKKIKIKKHHKHIAAILAIALLLLVLGAWAFDVYYKDKFYPNIVIGGYHAGGKSYAEVYTHFEKITTTLEKDGFVVEFKDEEGKPLGEKVTIPSASVGLTSDTVVEYYAVGDWERAVREAYERGRKGSFFHRTGEKLSGWLFRKFKLPVVVYEDSLEAFFKKEIEAGFEPPEDARFRVGAGKVTIVPEKVEVWIDPADARGEVSRALTELESFELTLTVRPQTPAVTQKKLERFLPRVEELLKNTAVVLTHNGTPYTVSGGLLVTWLTVDPQNESALAVKKEDLELYIAERITPAIADAPVNSRFEMRSGRLVETRKGRPGNNVNIEKIREGIARAVNSTNTPKRVSIEVEIVKTEPLLTAETIGRYGITERVGVARTSFAGSSADRRKNITLGISKLSGVLIAPGEEISTLSGIGEVSVAEGFVEEYVIKGDESVKEVGGGLCQVATTLFRSVLDAGLPITERQNHSYVVGYYGAGLDATIYPPHPDLKFVNDTGRYLLLQGRVEGDEAIFEFYGTKDGRKVTIGTPVELSRTPPPEPKYIPTTELAPGEEHCTERARDGVSTEATYTVAYPNGEVKEKVFKSWYRPWQKVCLVGVAAVPSESPFTRAE